MSRSSAAKTSSDAPAQPLFFSDPHPVSRLRHEGQGIHTGMNFDFARNAPAIPVTVREFVEVSRSYPIIFSMEEVPAPMVVTGYRQQNCFIDSEGNWQENHYVPHYVRKYPFALHAIQDQPGGKYVLCVDEAAPHFAASNPDLPFYDGETLADVAQEGLKLSQTYQRDHQATKDFCSAMQAMDMFEVAQIQATLATKERVSVGGFKTIAPAKWNEVAMNMPLGWVERGWAIAGFLALASQVNWKYLAAMHR